MFSLRTLSQHKILVIQKVFSPIYVIKRKERRSLLNILSSWVLVLYGIPESTKRPSLSLIERFVFFLRWFMRREKFQDASKKFFLLFFTTKPFCQVILTYLQCLTFPFYSINIFCKEHFQCSFNQVIRILRMQYYHKIKIIYNSTNLISNIEIFIFFFIVKPL